MNAIEILRLFVKERPDTPALIHPRGGAMTFSQLDEASSRVAGLLWQSGLRPGDSVLVFHPMAVELYVTLLALFSLNLKAIFIDPGAGRKQIERCCEQYPPEAFIGSTRAHLLRAISFALRRIPLKFVIGLPVPGAVRIDYSASPQQLISCSPETPALVTFTSGSTGIPKVIVRTHGFLLAQHRALSGTLRFMPDDVVLSGLPIFVLSHLASGITSVMPDADLRRPEAADPRRLARQLRDQHVSAVELPPALLERVASYCLRNNVTLTDVRQVYVGGAPVFPALFDLAQRAMPNANVVALYGSTEAEPIAHIAHTDVTTADLDGMRTGRGILAGHPISEIRLRILRDRWGEPVGPYTDQEFEAACVRTGQCGEIVISGENVVGGYLRGEGDAESKVRVGNTVWHRTGDAGYLDADGRLWLLGRCAARVCDENGVLYPLSVECAISDVQCIRRAAFVQRGGRRLLAVETRSRLSVTDIELIQQRVHWAHVTEIMPLRRIPVDRRHNSKIDYTALAAIISRDVSRNSRLRITPPVWPAPGRTRASSCPVDKGQTS